MTAATVAPWERARLGRADQLIMWLVVVAVATFELLIPAAVGAIVATGIGSSGPVSVVLMGVTAVVAIVLAVPLVFFRHLLRMVADDLDAGARVATAGDVVSAKLSMDGTVAELTAEVRALRLEVADLRRPWWKKVMPRAR